MISKGDVVHIAKLARLELTEEEVEKMQKDLSGILDYFNILKEAQSSKSKFSSSQELRNKNVIREDRALPKDMTKKLLSAAPDKKDNYIKVKSVLWQI